MTPYRHVILAAGLLALLAGGLSPPLQAESLRIGAEDDWYPYTALKDGKVQGMSVDIVKAAFAATDTQVELVPYPYARCMQMARNGELVACFNTAPTPRLPPITCCHRTRCSVMTSCSGRATSRPPPSATWSSWRAKKSP